MKENIVKFIKILKTELEDMIADVGAFLESSEQRYKDQSVTEYVYRENMCVLKEEIAALSMAIEDLEKLDPEQFSEMEEAGQYLLKKIITEAYENDMPTAIKNLVEKKIKKVIIYIQDSGS